MRQQHHDLEVAEMMAPDRRLDAFKVDMERNDCGQANSRCRYESLAALNVHGGFH